MLVAYGPDDQAVIASETSLEQLQVWSRSHTYGRCLPDQPFSTSDVLRVEKAQTWLARLARTGYSFERLQEIARALPFVGPYAAFARYMETLVELNSARVHRPIPEP